MTAMCARIPRASALLAATVPVLLSLTSCGGERTGTAFCRQLAREVPAIGEPVTTKTQALGIVERYERLLEKAPLTIEPDLRIVTDLLRMAAKVDTEDPAQVQELADASYKAEKASENVSDWVKSTCAVDLATGLSIEPPRTVPTTTTTVAAPAPTAAP